MTDSVVHDNLEPSTIEELKALIKGELEQACRAMPAWYWTIPEEVDLRDSAATDVDKVRRLLFGDIDGVEDEFDVSGWEQTQSVQDSTVKEELEKLLDGKLYEVVVSYAESQDLDPVDLIEELKEDEDFEPQNLEVPDVYYDFTYKNSVSVVAEAEFSLELKPSEALFTALRALQITPRAYLDACQRQIDENPNGWTIDDPGPFEDSLGLADDGRFETLAEAYEYCFWEELKLAKDSALFDQCELGVPAVDVNELVNAMLSEVDTSVIYIHTACSGTTVSKVGSEIPCHGLDTGATVLHVLEGFLASEKNPDYVDSSSTVKLIGSLPVKLDAFEVRKETPERIQKEPTLHPSISPEVQLFRAILDARELVGRTPGRIDEQAALEMAASIPAYRAKEFAAKLERLFQDEAILPTIEVIRARLLARADQSLSEVDRANGLIVCLAPGRDWDPEQAKLAKWLIAKGADVNARTANGVTPLMLATRRHNVELVEALIAAGADVHAQAKDSLSGCADNALSIAARGAVKATNVLARACLDRLVEAKACLPEGLIRPGDGVNGAYTPIRMAVQTQHAGLVENTCDRVLDRDCELGRLELNKGLLHSGIEGNAEIGFVLVDKGASPDGCLPDTIGENIRTVSSELRVLIKNQWDKTEADADQFLALMRSRMARNAIQGATSRMRESITAARRSGP